MKKLIIIILLLPLSATALSIEELSDNFLPKPLKVSSDAIAWELFEKTKEVEECTTTPEGYDDCQVKPKYGKEILALDKKEVTLMGFMFPLKQGDVQKEFLLGPYPQSCPFHYHVGPAMVVEVHSPDGVKFSYEPVKVKGTFSAEYNAEFGVFYYLKNAEILK